MLEKLKTDDPEFAEERFETFSRRSIRRLGRLLPDARGVSGTRPCMMTMLD